MRIWSQIGRATGAQAISLRVLEFGHGVSPVIFNHASDEVFYALEQIENGPSISPSCKVNINGQGFDVAPQTGIYLRPGQTMTVENSDKVPFILVSAQCPESTGHEEVITGSSDETKPGTFPGVRLVRSLSNTDGGSLVPCAG